MGVLSHGPRTAWWRQRRWIAVVVAGAAIAAGVAVVVTRDGSGGVERGPFEEAVDNLALSEGMTYRSTIAGADVDMTVTRQGDALGSMSLAGIDLQLLDRRRRHVLQGARRPAARPRT